MDSYSMEENSYCWFDENIPDTFDLTTKIPCGNEQAGCGVVLPYDKMQSHQLFCQYRKYACVEKSCSATVMLDDMVRHVAEDHPDSLLLPENNTFKFSVDLNSKPGTVVQKLLKCDQFFSLAWKIDTNIYVKVMYLNKTAEKYEYRIEGCEIDNGEMFLKRSEQKSLMRYCVESRIKWMSSICYSLDKLRMFNLDSLKIVLKVCRSRNFDNRIDEKALSLMECPICTEYMLEMIYQCSTGHSVCQECRLKFSFCPTCKRNYTGTRNLVLESFCSETFLPCLNENDGCKIVLSGAEMTHHKKYCKLRNISCMVSDKCYWKGKLYDIIKHFKDDHNMEETCDFSTRTNLFQDRYNSRIYRDEPKYIVTYAFNHVFSINYSINANGDTILWDFYLETYCEESPDDFFYKVCYSDDNKNTTFVKTVKNNASITIKCNEAYSVGNNVTIKIRKS